MILARVTEFEERGGNSGIPLGEKRRSEVLERRHLPISGDDFAARVSRAIVFASRLRRPVVSAGYVLIDTVGNGAC